MKLRLADADDAAAIAALWNDMIRDTLATFTRQEKTTAQIAALIDERAGHFWVAEGEGVLGFATYGPFRTGPGYAATLEHTIILAPSCKRQGTGRKLMKLLEQTASRAGCHVLVAGISSANPAAVAFHTALGFTKTAHMPEVGRKNGQWLDLIWMQKSL